MCDTQQKVLIVLFLFEIWVKNSFST